MAKSESDGSIVFRSMDEFRRAYLPDGDSDDERNAIPTPTHLSWPEGTDLADALLKSLSDALPSSR